jgi:hypothetical protein
MVELKCPIVLSAILLLAAVLPCSESFFVNNGNNGGKYILFQYEIFIVMHVLSDDKLKRYGSNKHAAFQYFCHL